MPEFLIEVPESMPWLKTHKPAAFRVPLVGECFLDTYNVPRQCEGPCSCRFLILEPLPKPPKYPPKVLGMWIAEDSNGTQYLYENRPKQGTGLEWLVFGGKYYVMERSFLDYYPFPAHLPWNARLIQIDETMVYKE